MSHAADGTPRRRYLAAACLVLAAAGVLVGDKLLGPLFYLLIGAASTVLLLGARRRHPPEIRLLARLAGIGALGLSLAGLTSVCIVPELAQGIVLKTGRSLQPVPVQAARVSVLLVVFSAFTSRLSGARWQTGRPAQVAAILAAVLVWIVPHLAAGLDSELRGECKAAMRSLVASLQVYLATSDGKYPPEGRWSGPLLSQSGGHQRLRCSVASGTGGSYAFNSALANARQDALEAPSSVVVLFESDTGRGASGGREILPSKPRHLGGDNYGFADGSVKWLARKKLPDGTWAKAPDADWVIWEPALKEGEEGAGL